MTFFVIDITPKQMDMDFTEVRSIGNNAKANEYKSKTRIPSLISKIKAEFLILKAPGELLST